MRRNSFEQTLPSEVREIIDRVMPRSDSEYTASGAPAKAAALAATALTAAPAAASAPAPAPEPKPASPQQSGMKWGGESAAPAAAAATTSPRPARAAETATRTAAASSAAATTAPKPVSPVSEPEPERSSGGGFAKIAVIAAALAACVAIGIIAALKFAKKPEKAPGSSEMIVAEDSTGEASSVSTTTTASTQAEETEPAEGKDSSSEENTATESTATTTATVETTVSESESAESSTTSTSTSSAPAATTAPQVTFSIPSDAQSFMFGNDGSGYSYKWVDDNDHAKGLKTVTWTIVVKGTVQDYVYIKVWKENETLYGEIYDPKGVFAGHEMEKTALKQNVEPILDEILNLRASELQDPSFRITKIRPKNAPETEPTSNHWTEGADYYKDWVKVAQQKALDNANTFLKTDVLGK